ncbi:VIT1/CCC1 transporter family protein [Thiohalomonas denitrificans]|uniref:VIT family protein n=1 Tax=Thiohalomonas denitrificans TaxID=415747 RepID=A0A1G5Q4C6_9GAMM|nr:VIT1/CCC1 transporter family protein [Thiohalomonas denitrificans]SCZ56149.1 VIT family protein [Thiohalomonas denitrificans]
MSNPQPSLNRSGRYIKDMVYGANDGIITTFAVVAGVTGGQLSLNAVLTIGLASLFADGFSMAASDFLGSRSEQHAREAQGAMLEENRSALTGAALTFTAFLLAGAVPLLPYLLAHRDSPLFFYAALATAAALAGVGALRALVTKRSLTWSALEMLAIGGFAAVLAYAVGYQINALIAV